MLRQMVGVMHGKMLGEMHYKILNCSVISRLLGSEVRIEQQSFETSKDVNLVWVVKIFAVAEH